MSEIKVNKITPRAACGTTTLGDSGDTIAIAAGVNATLGGAGSTITIPSGATITNSGTASGFGATGEISWDTTVKTTGTFTAAAGVGYFLNTTGGVITVNLPAGVAGSSVALADYAGTWQTDNVTVTPNGAEKMGGVAGNVVLDTEGQSVTFVYIDGTQGWVNVLDSTSNVRADTYIIATGGDAIATCGSYKTHIFTGPGTFCVSSLAGTASNDVVDYLVVAGGGGGGGADNEVKGGGGGAGGFRMANSLALPAPTTSPLASPTGITVTASPYSISVGAAGAGAPTSPPSNCNVGTVGGVSIFDSITSAGGGYGGSYANNGSVAGGSGGGGGTGAGAPTNPSTGAAGNTPATPIAQGTPGGLGNAYGSAPTFGVESGGGGGGGAVAGTDANVPADGALTPGGDGGYIADSFVGPTAPSYGSPGPASSTRYFAGGGGGGQQGTASPGGAGGGGSGGNSTNAPAPAPTAAGQAATINTGGGGGGAGAVPAGTNLGGGGGASGIVMIRYKYQ